MDVYVFKRGYISMIFICYVSDVIEYDKRTPDLSNAALHITQDTTSMEE